MATKSLNKVRKRTEEKLDWEELETAPNVEGMLSYLRAPLPTTVPFLPGSVGSDRIGRQTLGSEPPGCDKQPSFSQASKKPPENGVDFLPAQSEPSTRAGEPLATESIPGVTPTCNTLRSDTLPSDIIPSDWPLTVQSVQPLPRITPITDVPGLGKRRYHRCVFAQEAHTPGEQAVLSGLYRLGKNPRFGRVLSDGSLRVCVSLVELGRQIAMHETNVRVNVRSLIKKLAIEQVRAEDKKQQSAREYHVYTLKQILERRRVAGLEWVVKGRGVQFVPTDAVLKTLPSDTLPSDYMYDDEE